VAKVCGNDPSLLTMHAQAQGTAGSSLFLLILHASARAFFFTLPGAEVCRKLKGKLYAQIE
jgi:hypothetical protein